MSTPGSVRSGSAQSGYTPAHDGGDSTRPRRKRTRIFRWEGIVPLILARLFRRPPVLSTCWLIRRDTLTEAGTKALGAQLDIADPYFAREAIKHDGYGFMQASNKMGIISHKSVYEQQSTAIRVQYPRVHRRVELVAFLSLAEIFSLLMPYILLVLAVAGLLPTSYILPNSVAVVLLTAMYVTITTITYRLWLVRSLVLLPVAAILDVFLLNYSMIRYEFFTVIWKDRNVCIPVMQVVGHLPEPARQ